MMLLLNYIFSYFTPDFTTTSWVKPQTDKVSVLDFVFSSTHLLLISFWVSEQLCKLFLDSSIKKNPYNTQTVPLSAAECSSLYSQTQVCTRRNASLLCPHSSLRNQDWHSGVNDALASSPSPTPSLLPSQYTNTIPQPAVWCGNSIHISCQPERFLGLIHELQGWVEEVTPRPCPEL